MHLPSNRKRGSLIFRLGEVGNITGGTKTKNTVSDDHHNIDNFVGMISQIPKLADRYFIQTRNFVTGLGLSVFPFF